MRAYSDVPGVVSGVGGGTVAVVLLLLASAGRPEATLPPGPCCEADHGAGCDDATVQDCVCAVDSSCCDSDWTAACVALVDTLDCGSCGLPPLGACCVGPGACNGFLTEAQCDSTEGAWRGAGTSCAEVDCEAPTTGACCLSSTSCNGNLTPSQCFSAGGEWQGADISCAAVDCAAITQACCLSDGNCLDIAAALCTQQEGTPVGEGTTCDDVFCPAPDQACCLPDGSCQDDEPSDCVFLDGEPQGVDSACATTTCPQQETIACCIDSSCFDLTAGSCSGLGGESQGPGSDCTSTGCATPTQACCFGDLTCQDLETSACFDQGGVSQGVGTDCAATQCPPQTVACCFDDGSCFDISTGTCSGEGGVSQGPGTTCSSATCPDPTVACCLPDGMCSDLASSDCFDAGGVDLGEGSDCATGQCPAFEACCFGDDSCQELPAMECGARGGAPQGSESDCTDLPCQTPRACCLSDGRCFDVVPTDCTIVFGGQPQPEGVHCEGIFCPAEDCNENGVPDIQELSTGETDVNTNGVLDECDIAYCTAGDLDHNGLPDEYDIELGGDANTDGIPDIDTNTNGIPDRYEQSMAHSHVALHGKPDSIRDDVLAQKLRELLVDVSGQEPSPNARNAIFLFQQCYGGGFLDDLATQLGDDVQWVAGSAASHDEIAHAEGLSLNDPLPSAFWTQELLVLLNGDRTVYQAIKQSAQRNSNNPRNGSGSTERSQYRKSSTGCEIEFPDNGAQSRHAVILAGVPDAFTIDLDVERYCDLLQTSWGDLSTNGTSVHVLFGDGTRNPCASAGVPAANVAAATQQNLFDVLSNLKNILGPEEQFVLIVHDHGQWGGGFQFGGSSRGVPAITTVSFDVPESVYRSVRLDPFNAPTIWLRADGPFLPGIVEVFLNGRRLGYLDPAQAEGTQFTVPEGALLAGENTIEVDISLLPPGLVTVESGEFETGLVALKPRHAFGDSDGDGDVDGIDTSAFANCLSGPGGGYSSPDCNRVDFDFDGDVDLFDFRYMQKVYTGEWP